MNRRKQHFRLLRLFCASEKTTMESLLVTSVYISLTTESWSSVFQQASLEAPPALGNQVNAVLQG